MSTALPQVAASRRVPRLLALLALALSCAACAPEPARPSVLLVTVDTLRADHLGCYGYERETSPNLDAFAREGVLFETAYSHAPFTAPSHASLLTSLHPPSHGVLFWGMELDPAAKTFAERFGAAGFRTGSFYNHPGMEPLGLTRGSDEVQVRIFEPAGDTVQAFLKWIDAGEGPFAAWLHLWDVHRPYAYRSWRGLPEAFQKRVQRDDPTLAFGETRFGETTDVRVGRTEAFYNLNPQRRAEAKDVGGTPHVLTDEDLEYISDRYDAGVWYADQGLGALFTGLRERELLDEMVVVVTADHGESLLERDECLFTHDPFLYEETLRVPLILRLPGAEHGGARVKELARGVDVLPTLLDLAGLPAGEKDQGRSLRALWSGGESRRTYLFSQTQTRNAKEREARATGDEWLENRRAVSDGRYKLIVDLEHGSTELYDLHNDPAEGTDLSAEPAAAEELERLRQVLRAFEALPEASRSKGSLSAEQEELLRGIGYL